MRPMSAVGLGIMVTVLGGCRTWATVDDNFQWSIKVPEKVAHVNKQEVRFSVETRTPTGEVAEGVSFYWVIEWVGVRGSTHKGKSFSEESIRIKGRQGSAVIKIFAYNHSESLVEVASAHFEVE